MRKLIYSEKMWQNLKMKFGRWMGMTRMSNNPWMDKYLATDGVEVPASVVSKQFDIMAEKSIETADRKNWKSRLRLFVELAKRMMVA